MNEGKRGLRDSLRAARRSMAPDVRGAESAATSQACLDLAAGRVVCSYAALPDELDLDALHRHLWRGDGRLLLPRVAGPGRLDWHAVGAAGLLQRGAYGISEPDPQRCPPAVPPSGALLLLPGVGFTADGRRLGQGGGFYDRLLAERPDLLAVGVGFSCQLVADIPCEAHDRRLNGLVIAGRVVLAPGPT